MTEFILLRVRRLNVVFQHIPKPVVISYMTDLRRVLRSGGVALSQFSRIDAPGYVAPDDGDGMVVDRLTMRNWRREEVEELLAGWRSFEVEERSACEGMAHYLVTAHR